MSSLALLPFKAGKSLDTNQFSLHGACYLGLRSAVTATQSPPAGMNLDEGETMFVDEVVVSGLVIVALTCAFFGGVYWAVKQDISKHGTGE